MNAVPARRRVDLARIAAETMTRRGLEPEFGAAVAAQLAALEYPVREDGAPIADLRDMAWIAIDDDALALDRLTACEPLADGAVRIFVAVTDVDRVVAKGTPIDDHARHNATSVDTVARRFPLLPQRLASDFISFCTGRDRQAVVTTMVVGADGAVTHPRVQRAWVRSRATLAYDALSAWLDGAAALPGTVGVAGLGPALRCQDDVAQRLRARRHAAGALDADSLPPRAEYDGERVIAIRSPPNNRARQLIAELTTAAEQATAQFLAEHGGATLRRVVRSPERWRRIAMEARKHGEVLPVRPDASALGAFLARRREAEPQRFPELSLVIGNLMGAGEYVVEGPGAAHSGHFGRPLRDPTVAAAPMRRFPNLVTTRLLKAALAGSPPPYSAEELRALAAHCSRQEDAAQMVERTLRKCEAALLLESHVGQRYEAIVNDCGDHDTWIRTLLPPVDGRLTGHAPELQVGQRVQVRLVSTDVERGFIDFERLA